jgi:hypothetical protein
VPIDDFAWVHSLTTSEIVLNREDDDHPLDSENDDLLPTIIEKIVLPYFTKLLKSFFNPHNMEEIQNIKKTLSDLEEFVNASNPVMDVSVNSLGGIPYGINSYICFLSSISVEYSLDFRRAF